MPRLFPPGTPSIEEYRQELEGFFPGAKFGALWDVNAASADQFDLALTDGREEAIQIFLTQNPYFIQYAVKTSGHHGIWVFPKAMIRPRGMDGTAGLIPDYLVCTRSSLGFFWHVVEIKRYGVQFSNAAGDGYSQDGHKAIAQCANYLSHMSEYIESVRSNIRVPDLITPVGAIILIGNSSTETEAQKSCRANFVKQSPKIEVVSYERIRQSLASDLEFRTP